jgi:hypothetical protein
MARMANIDTAIRFLISCPFLICAVIFELADASYLRSLLAIGTYVEDAEDVNHGRPAILRVARTVISNYRSDDSSGAIYFSRDILETVADIDVFRNDSYPSQPFRRGCVIDTRDEAEPNVSIEVLWLVIRKIGCRGPWVTTNTKMGLDFHSCVAPSARWHRRSV